MLSFQSIAVVVVVLFSSVLDGSVQSSRTFIDQTMLHGMHWQLLESWSEPFYCQVTHSNPLYTRIRVDRNIPEARPGELPYSFAQDVPLTNLPGINEDP